MKVEINGQQVHPRRGGAVEVGNVYGNAYGKPFFRLVVGVVERVGERPWKNIVCIRLDTSGNIVGCANEPEAYVREHQDLIGKVHEMPNMKIEWFRSPQKFAAYNDPNFKYDEATGSYRRIHDDVGDVPKVTVTTPRPAPS